MRSDCARTSATSARIASIPPWAFSAIARTSASSVRSSAPCASTAVLGGLRVARRRASTAWPSCSTEASSACRRSRPVPISPRSAVALWSSSETSCASSLPVRRAAVASVWADSAAWAALRGGLGQPLDARAERAQALAAGLDLAADGGALLAGAAGVLAGGGGGLLGGRGGLAGAERLLAGALELAAGDLQLAGDARDGAAQLVGLGAAGDARLLGAARQRGGLVDAVAHAAHVGEHVGGAAIDLGDALGGVAGGGERLAGLLAGAGDARRGRRRRRRRRPPRARPARPRPGRPRRAGRRSPGRPRPSRRRRGARPRPRWRPRRCARRCAPRRRRRRRDGLELVARGEALGQRLDARDAGGQAVGGAGDLLQAACAASPASATRSSVRPASAAALSTSSSRVPTPSAASGAPRSRGRPRELLELGLQRGGLGLRLPDGGGDLAAQLGGEGAELLVLDGVGGQLDGDRGLVLAQRGADLGELREGVLGGGAELLALGPARPATCAWAGSSDGLGGAQLVGDAGDLVVAAADLGLRLDDLLVALGEVVLRAQDVERCARRAPPGRAGFLARSASSALRAADSASASRSAASSARRRELLLGGADAPRRCGGPR